MGKGLVQQLWRDAIYGARALRREPSFAATALLTLTLGIGTTTTVFTLVDAELWKPLPFPDPSQLVAVYGRKPAPSGESELFSMADFEDMRAQARLAEYAASSSAGRRVLRRGIAESVTVEPVSANYFRVLGHAPRLGRAFDPITDANERVAIASDGAWRRLFDSDPQAVGRVLSLDGVDYTVIGINAGQHPGLGGEPDLYIAFDRPSGAPTERSVRAISITGRIARGVSVAQATAELQAIVARIAAAYPDDRAGHGLDVSDLRLAYSGYNWRPLYFFLAAAIAVLLLACLNVASLLLARALRRQREFAIRGALGGGTPAIARQLLVEGALLALPSAAAATLLSTWTLRVFERQIPDDYLARGGHFALDARVTLFVIALALLATVLLSLAPVFFARRVDLNAALGHGSRTGQSLRQRRVRSGLLVAQLTVTLILVTGAGLFARSFLKLVNVPLGFEPEDRLSIRLTLSGARYDNEASYRTFADQLLERARAIPGVQDAAVDSSSPLDSGPPIRVAAGDRPRPVPGAEPRGILRAVTPDYFRTLGIPVTGRAFSNDDTAGNERVAIVNQYLADQLFPGETAVGKPLDLVPGARMQWAQRPGIYRIVGVITNVKDVSVNEVEFGNVYLPFAVAPASRLELLVRTGLPPAGIFDAVRRAVADLDPALPVTRLQTLSTRVNSVLQGDRFNVLLISVFAGVGIFLAAIGIYGAMACAVEERTREFGVKLALGLPPSALIRATLWESARFGVIGSVIGLGAVLAVAAIIGDALYLVRGQHSGLLYGVTTTDPIALATAATALIVVAAISGIVPARRATRVDPMIALRAE